MVGGVVVSMNGDDRDVAGRDVTVGAVVPEHPVTLTTAAIAKMIPLMDRELSSTIGRDYRLLAVKERALFPVGAYVVRFP